MRITDRRLVLLVVLTVAGGLLLPARYPAAKDVIDAVAVCVLVCYLMIEKGAQGAAQTPLLVAGQATPHNENRELHN